jgi:hypothetical protein
MIRMFISPIDGLFWIAIPSPVAPSCWVIWWL